MDEIYKDVLDFMKKPAIFETFVDILLCAVPIWVAIMIGLVIGWSWRPRWTGLVFLGLRSKFRFLWTAPPGFGARRLWFAFTAFSAFSVARRLWSSFHGKSEEAVVSVAVAVATAQAEESLAGGISTVDRDIVTGKDLEHLIYLLEEKGGLAAWQNLMDRTTSNMSYQAWRLEPETGPTVYRSRTVYEDASPELVRDFFWDDEFRRRWDPMLSYFKIVEECHQTGKLIVHWIKKFPFFCSDREYIIGRRIWESGKTYYCVTKSVPYSGLEKHDKPRRVELYYSSWIIKAVESRKRDGQLSACEVTLIHYEDMGIPKDVAKLGVRHGMWGTVKKIHSGMRAYQVARKSDTPLSRCALMAQITTKIHIESSSDPAESEGENQESSVQKIENGIDWRWVVLGGTVAVVCGLHTSVIGKSLLIGAARRLARNMILQSYPIVVWLKQIDP